MSGEGAVFENDPSGKGKNAKIDLADRGAQ
jgi:hypothetical protein